MSKLKTVSIKELRSKKSQELLKLLQERQMQVLKDGLDLVGQKTKNTNILKPSRQLIARIKTVLAEKRDLDKLAVSTPKK